MAVTTQVATSRRSSPIPQVLLLCAGAVLLNLAMTAAEDHLSALGPAAATPSGRGVAPWLDWILSDTTEAQFFTAWPAGAGLLAAAAVAHLAARRRWRARGFDIAYGTGLWPWLLLAAGGGARIALTAGALGTLLAFLIARHLPWMPTPPPEPPSDRCWRGPSPSGCPPTSTRSEGASCR
ncbi:hypothetical protein [Actinomadura macra]|uniref:hypothetical protein n=1 Tax=Actinomadura macra TaxID=46164 RepID=UPI00082D7488|nr:hypothetical protein [Actinomadura macra]